MTDPISIVNMLCDAAKEQGKDVSAMLNTPDKDGRTPLHVGAMRGATISCLHMLKVSVIRVFSFCLHID